MKIKKTAAVIGVGGSKGKNLTSVTIARTVKIGNVTYKVTRISKKCIQELQEAEESYDRKQCEED